MVVALFVFQEVQLLLVISLGYVSRPSNYKNKKNIKLGRNFEESVSFKNHVAAFHSIPFGPFISLSCLLTFMLFLSCFYILMLSYLLFFVFIICCALHQREI